MAAERIVATAHALVRILVFGSYARGDADARSDLDLMVIEADIPDYPAEYQRLHRILGNLGVGVDLVLFTEAEFEKKRGWWSTPVYWAAREGRVLYERA
jgi:predicted nucleotidyltransferase